MDLILIGLWSMYSRTRCANRNWDFDITSCLLNSRKKSTLTEIEKAHDSYLRLAFEFSDAWKNVGTSLYHCMCVDLNWTSPTKGFREKLKNVGYEKIQMTRPSAFNHIDNLGHVIGDNGFEPCLLIKPLLQNFGWIVRALCMSITVYWLSLLLNVIATKVEMLQ